MSLSEALDEEIRSKQRTLALLDKRLDGGEALNEQILQRDRRIDELNARVLAAEAKGKAKNKASSTKQKELVKKLTQDLYNAQVFRLKSDDMIAHMRTEVSEWKAKAEDEKEAGELLSEALTEQVEGHKAELAQKKVQISEMKKDILQLSKIIQDMTKLNAELNAQIDATNRDTARINSSYYAAVAKGDQVELLENELSECTITCQRLEKQVGRLTETLDRSHQRRLAIEAESREAQTSLQQLSTVLRKASAVNDEQFTPVSVQVIEGLKAIRHKLKAATPQEVSKSPHTVEETPLQLQLKDLKAKLKDKERLIAREQAETWALRSRLSRIDSQHEKDKAEWTDAVERYQKRASVLLEQVTGFSDRLDTCRDELGKKDFEVQKCQTQVLHLKERAEEMKQKTMEYMERSNHLEKVLKEQRASILRIQTERFDEQKLIAMKEKQANKAMANVKAMQEELFYKDTEIMRRAREVTALSVNVSDLDSRLKASQAASGRSKSVLNEGADALGRRLEEKNKEISILKEMIRGAQVELKQKESLIMRYRRRPDEVLPYMKTMPSVDDDIGVRLDEFLAEVTKAEELAKKVSQAKVLTQAIERLQQGLELDMQLSVRRLRDRGSEKLKRLLPVDGSITVSELLALLGTWFRNPR
jgi:chromosome segregation ATPase